MNIQNILPQFFPGSWEQDLGVYAIPFTSEVYIGFVEREGGGYSYLLKDNVDVVPETLLQNSLDNLKNLKDEVEVKVAHPPGATVLWVNAVDNFAAIRLLLPSVMRRIKEEMGPQFLFTIPSRDLMLCWNGDAPDPLTDKHAQEAREDFEAEEYSLSPHVYQYNDTWPSQKIR